MFMMKKNLVFLFLLLLSPGLNAQLIQDFEPVNGNTNIVQVLRGSCWRVTGFQSNNGGVLPITGSSSMVSGNGANATSSNGLQTPYLNFTGNDSLAFVYKWYGNNITNLRWVRVMLVDFNGNSLLQDSIPVDVNTQNVIQYSHVFTGITGHFRIFLNFRGNGGQGRFGIDDFFSTAPFLYPTGCLNADFDTRRDNQDVDDDNDGIQDFVEACGIGATAFSCLTANPSADSDNDGVTNFYDAQFCTLNANGVCSQLDFDGDGIPNFQDLDSDGDGILDAIEANGGNTPNNYQNGIITGNLGTNGMPNQAETTSNSGISIFPLSDTDADGFPDWLDTDSDNDGIPDNIEAQGTFSWIAPSGLDSDRDGIDDAYDGLPGFEGLGLTPINTDGTDLPDYLDTDADNDGVADAQEAHDLNANALADVGELPFAPLSLNSDADGFDDAWDLVPGFSINHNLTPLSFPDAGLGTNERDYREPNVFVPEICNNGLDDDGDGDADCADADCPKPVIVQITANPSTACGALSDGSIDINANGAAEYSIDNGLSFSPQSLFSNLPAGTYQVVVRNSNGCTIAFTGNPIVFAPVDCPPIANTDHFITNEDVNISAADLANNDDATDGPQTLYTTTPIQAPALGTLTLFTNGSFNYVPNADVFGTDSFVYELCDGNGNCDTALVFITINSINDLPVIINESLSNIQNNVLIANLLGNDSDVEGPLSLNLSGLINPANGSVVVQASGDFAYTPNLNFIGNDFFVVPVCDNDGVCINDTVFIEVSPLSNLPIVNNETLTVLEDQTLNANLLLNDSDPDGLPLSVQIPILQTPANGSFIIQPNGDLTYLPNLNFFGTDQIIVSVCDADLNCINDTVFITVTPVDDLPLVSNENISTNEDVAVNGAVLTNDSDVEGPVSVQLPLLTSPANGAVTMQSDGTFTYTPNNNFSGNDFFVVSVCDATGNCINDTVFISVNPINDAPLVNNEQLSTNEDVVLNANILSNDSDVDGTLSVNIVLLQNPANGVAVVDASGNLTYTPNPDFNGNDQLIAAVCDNDGLCVNDTVFITVNPVDDLPLVNNENLVTNENVAANGDILANDSDLDGPVIIQLPALVSPLNGSAIIQTDGTFVYTPNAGFNGNDLLVVLVCDGQGNCVNDTVFITVNPVNDLPLVFNEQLTTLEDVPLNANILLNDSDPDGSVSANPVLVQNPANGTATVDAAGNLVYTPNLNFNGTDQLIIAVCDNDGACINDTVSITVVPVNDTPDINNDTFNVLEDTPFSGNFLGNDSDPEGPLTVNTVLLLDPANGSLVVQPNGDLIYTPNPNFAGIDTAIVIICDADAICENDTLFFNVGTVNDTLVVLGENFGTNEDETLLGNILGNDFDPDGSALAADTFLIQNPSNGTFVVQPNGDFVYTPNLNFFGVDTAIVLVCDNGIPLPPTCLPDTIIINVFAQNDPPIILNDTLTMLEDNIGLGNMVSNDVDPDSTLLNAGVILTPPQFGSFTINPNGDYTYTPLPNFYGNDFVVVQICDNGFPVPPSCVKDTLFILVLPVNDAPVIVNDTVTVMSGFTVSGDITNASDVDVVEGTGLTVDTSTVSGPQHGTLVLLPDGTFIYTSTAPFVGVDTVIVSVCDNGIPLPGACVNDTLFILVTPQPDSANAGIDQFLCDSVTTLQGNLPNFGSGIWTQITGSGSIADSSLFNTAVSGLAVGSNTFVWTNTFGTIVTTDTVTIVVSQFPSPAFAGYDTELCGFNTTLAATPPVLGTGVWTVLSGGANIADVNNPASAVSGLALGSNQLIWTVSYNTCPNTIDTIQITTALAPSLAIAGPDLSICGSGIALAANAPVVGSGYWEVASGYVEFTDMNSPNSIINNVMPGINVLTWTIFNGACPAQRDTLVINAGDPFIGISAGSDTLVCGSDAPLNGMIPSFTSGTWTLLSGLGTIDDPKSAKTSVSLLADGWNVFLLTVLNGGCPNAVDTLIITGNGCDSTLFVPEGFSPNNDGVNDFWIISGAKDTRVEVEVYNRWGNKVFTSNDYQNDWDGTSSGTGLVESTYYYIIRVEGESKARTGYLTVWK
jgi:gliding motility-associated-like protein